MRIIHVSYESSSVQECLEGLRRRFEEELRKKSGTVVQAEIGISFGAFMNASVTALVADAEPLAGILTEHTTGRNREHAMKNLISKINSAIGNVDVISFRLGSYTTPVTRRTYAVGVVVYNRRLEDLGLSNLETERRRELLAHVLRTFGYNVKVLNISELARIFGVSRDTIYYDIESIIKRRKT
ncbi:MAG: hypothetical protein GXO14_04240 [Thermococci archaeon]|nr:hypothetical protein [Thermococci archaeon]